MMSTGVHHGDIGEVPAWVLFPHISLWAVESGKAPGWVGWWVICGDCPTDYVGCTGDRTPRSAIGDFAKRWRIIAATLLRSESHPDFGVGNPDNARELAPILSARAKFLEGIAADDGVWDV
jgi:hypothetical protein